MKKDSKSNFLVKSQLSLNTTWYYDIHNEKKSKLNSKKKKKEENQNQNQNQLHCTKYLFEYCKIVFMITCTFTYDATSYTLWCPIAQWTKNEKIVHTSKQCFKNQKN